MEDKKVLEFVQKNYEKEHEQYKKQLKKENKKEKIKSILYCGLALVIFITLAVVVHNDTKKAISNCVNNGNNYNTCLMEVQ